VKHVTNPPVVGKELRFETELPLNGQLGISLIKGPAFHDPRERGPNAGGLLSSQTVQMKKAEMVLHLVFREPVEIRYATTTTVCPPPTSHSPTQIKLCATFQRVQNVGYLPRSRCTGSSRGKLVYVVAAWGQLSKPWAKQSFVVSDGHLIRPDIYRASLVGRSSNDEAQASMQ
jgi:hypothetical protein